MKANEAQVKTQQELEEDRSCESWLVLRNEKEKLFEDSKQ